MEKLIFLGLLSFESSFAQNLFPEAIYGSDDRQEVIQIQNPVLREIAKSTVAIIDWKFLKKESDQTYRFERRVYGERYGLCPEERFYSQPALADCSGFLVGPNQVATAGHCVYGFRCEDQSFVFGFQVDTNGVAPSSISSKDVYRCRRVIASEYDRNQDWAIVELDRSVEGRNPLKLAKNQASVGEPVIALGHPTGLPTKVTANAKIRSVHHEYFVANLDTYQVSSGSPVLSERTNEVLGVLVRGEKDFEYIFDRKCHVSYRCNNERCRGEDINHIELLRNALKIEQSK